MKMRKDDIIKEIPMHLIPTYKMLGWEEVIEEVKEKEEEVEQTPRERLTKGFGKKLVEKDINEEE